MFGRLLDTLRFRLDAEEKEWRSLNRLRKELQPALWQRAMLQMAGRPMHWGLSLFGLVSLLVLAAMLVDSRYWVVIDVDEFNVADPAAYFSTLWSVQAAIAALVYPIVIAFVTLLVGRSGSAKAALHIYLHDSAALLAGLSALLLVAEMGLQYLWVPYVDKTTLMAWIGLDGLWFTFNIGLTTYFLFRTFEFMQPARRFEITRRYAINVAWPREARFHLARHIFVSAVEGNLLPGPGYGAAKEGEPSVLAGFIGLSSGVAAVERNQSARRVLRDIRFKLLAWATGRWLTRANSVRSRAPKSEAWKRGGRDALISFPVVPFESYEGKTPLCRVEGEATLTAVERLAVRFSFVFGAGKDDGVDITADDILEDAQAVVVAALRAGEVEAFKDALKRMLELYESLLDASQVKDVNGGPMSIAQLADRNHWFDSSIHKMWSRRFVDLYEAATSKLAISDEYVRFLAHIPNRMFGVAQESAVPEIAKHAMLLSPILLRRVEDWWVQTVEQQGQIDHNLCRPTTLRPPFHGVHDKVLREIVGSWESLKNHDILPREENQTDWSSLQRSAEYFEEHLSHTLVSLCDCILRGDQNAAEWLADVLVKWYSELQFRFDGVHDYFLRKQRLVTIELMSQDWVEVERRVQVESFGAPGSLNHMAVLAACLNNLWTDTCCVAIYVLAVWSKECKCEQSLPAKVAADLISGRPLRQGGHAVGGDTPYDGTDDLLMTILRQYFADGHYRRGYRNRLDKYVERIAELSKSEMISGRIYSWSGADDLDSVRDGQLMVLLLAVPKDWKPGPGITELLGEWSNTDNEKVREFARMLDAWKTRINDPSFSEVMEGYECLRSKVAAGARVEFVEARASFGHAIEQLIALVNEVRSKALENAPPSERRLLEIGQWASREGFAIETSSCPLPLFDEISPVVELLPARSLAIKGMRKGEFTDPPMDDTASNESEWFAHTMRDHVAASVLGATLAELKPEVVSIDTPEAYWARMQRFASDVRQAGLHPILLLENPTVPGWLWEWAHPPFDGSKGDIPDGLIVSRDDKEAVEGYQWSFNDIPVFNAPLPLGASILAVRESFERIEFTRLPDGSFVKATTRTVEGHPELVDLVFSWYVRVGVKQFPSVQLSYDERGRRRRQARTRA
ncbi:MAG: hypothetical protein K9J74_12555 [Sulfuritalea sp.]|nr:hypothetical protein [Sulfuritalea sp.]